MWFDSLLGAKYQIVFYCFMEGISQFLYTLSFKIHKCVYALYFTEKHSIGLAKFHRP